MIKVSQQSFQLIEIGPSNKQMPSKRQQSSIRKLYFFVIDWIQKTVTQELARTFKKCGMDFLDDDQDLFCQASRKNVRASIYNSLVHNQKAQLLIWKTVHFVLNVYRTFYLLYFGQYSYAYHNPPCLSWVMCDTISLRLSACVTPRCWGWVHVWSGHKFYTPLGWQ